MAKDDYRIGNCTSGLKRNDKIQKENGCGMIPLADRLVAKHVHCDNWGEVMAAT